MSADAVQNSWTVGALGPGMHTALAGTTEDAGLSFPGRHSHLRSLTSLLSFFRILRKLTKLNSPSYSHFSCNHIRMCSSCVVVFTRTASAADFWLDTDESRWDEGRNFGGLEAPAVPLRQHFK